MNRRARIASSNARRPPASPKGSSSSSRAPLVAAAVCARRRTRLRTGLWAWSGGPFGGWAGRRMFLFVHRRSAMQRVARKTDMLREGPRVAFRRGGGCAATLRGRARAADRCAGGLGKRLLPAYQAEQCTRDAILQRVCERGLSRVWGFGRPEKVCCTSNTAGIRFEHCRGRPLQGSIQRTATVGPLVASLTLIRICAIVSLPLVLSQGWTVTAASVRRQRSAAVTAATRES